MRDSKLEEFSTVDDSLSSGYEFMAINEAEMFVKVSRNQEVIRSLPKFKGRSQNVLVIYIDALSRVTAHRRMPKLMNWFR